eukprot:Filipodium_phascolosomae@DN2706_c0_g1_i1.p1
MMMAAIVDTIRIWHQFRICGVPLIQASCLMLRVRTLPLFGRAFYNYAARSFWTYHREHLRQLTITRAAITHIEISLLLLLPTTTSIRRHNSPGLPDERLLR